jgi:hypothetical protein
VPDRNIGEGGGREEGREGRVCSVVPDRNSGEGGGEGGRGGEGRGGEGVFAPRSAALRSSSMGGESFNTVGVKLDVGLLVQRPQHQEHRRRCP